MSDSSGKSMRPRRRPGHTLFEGSDDSIVCHPCPTDEFPSAENVHILETWNTAQDKNASIARARLEPGMETENHLLKTTTERYLVHSGEGEVRIGEMVPRRVVAGDVVFIPPGVPQSIRNTGSVDLVFYCICTPRFQAGDYQSLAMKPS
ncbi:MAG: cupin domain-containing protein [Gammaproteobacteria bacterium]